MRSFFRLFFIALLLGMSTVSNGQKIEIYGKVLDKDTKEIIPFANIAIKDIYKGTASNALGEFSFKVDSLPLDLIVTHLSYESQEIRVAKSEELIIELTPGKLLMHELVIKGAGNDDFAYDLVRKAYYKVIGKGRNQRYGKAFYRQISKNGDEFSELYEIFYDTRYTNNGVEDWAIQEGRYALKLSTVDSFIYNKNFTQMVRLLTVVQPKTEDLIVPVSEDVYEYFNLTTDRIITVNNRNVAQISFNKKKDVPFPALEGEIHIDVDSYDILKVKGKIVDDDLKFITLTGKRSSWKDYVVQCEIVFQQVDEDLFALDYMRLQQNFDYYVDDVFANKVETKSFFTYYEYYDPPKRKKLGGRLLRFNQRDSDILDDVGYNQLFWDENIIVKRTPIEAEVTESFERERAFGSIYLNNKNQLILEDYEIDNDPFIVQVRSQLKHYPLPRKGEKIYIHHDKPIYMKGDDFWFKAYILNMATNSPATASQTLHVELKSPGGNTIKSALFPISEGRSTGKLTLPDDLGSGMYKLVAYTDWMQNFPSPLFYEEDLSIINNNDESGLITRSLVDSLNTLKLFAEGGTLVNNMPGQVGFVAKNRFGQTIDLRGRLLNTFGRQVAPIKSEFHGFGSMFVLPQKSEEYRTMIMSDEVVADPFPKIEDKGYAIMVNNLKPNSIDITVRGTPNLEGKKFYILAISNGVLFDRRIGMLTRSLYKTEIPKSNLPSGIAQLLLVDEIGNVVNKRLIFLDQPDAATVKYYMPKREFRPRERVDMVIEVNDENGKNLGFSNISVSVLDRDKISRNESKRNIRSYLSLEHMLDYNLEEPGILFTDFERETLKDFDYIMLNQQTIYPEIQKISLSPSPDDDILVQRSKNIMLYGQVVMNSDKKPLSNGYLSFIARPDSDNGCWYVKTDENGKFNLSGVNITDPTKAVLLAYNASGKEVSVEVSVRSSRVPDLLVTTDTMQVELEPDLKRYLNEIRKREIQFRGVGHSVVKTQGKNDIETICAFGEPFQQIIIDEKYNNFSNLGQLLNSRLAGTDKKNDFLQIKGLEGSPLYVIDGIVMNLRNIFSNETEGGIPEKYASIPVADIARIDIIKDTEEINIFGKSCSNGIVSIHTKPGFSVLQNYESELLKEVWLPGYQQEVSFMSPDYSDEQPGQGIDNRSTLYWNPDITTNRKGRAKISFYNSDEARNMQICVEGIATDGTPIFDIYDFGRNYNSKRDR